MTDSYEPGHATAGAEAPGAPRRRGWPLVLVACGSLIPFLGILFAATALSWALLTDRPRRKLAIGLVVAGSVLNVGGVALIGVLTEGNDTAAGERAAAARRDLAALVGLIEQYRADHGRYPSDLLTLTTAYFPRPVHVYDMVPAGFRVPRTYQYRLAADGASYDLFSVGKDGIPYTPDDVRPVLPDSILARSGYRPAPGP